MQKPTKNKKKQTKSVAATLKAAQKAKQRQLKEALEFRQMGTSIAQTESALGLSKKEQHYAMGRLELTIYTESRTEIIRAAQYFGQNTSDLIVDAVRFYLHAKRKLAPYKKPSKKSLAQQEHDTYADKILEDLAQALTEEG